jgi:succinate dehydrogenase hydrophobic anchor subunit
MTNTSSGSLLNKVLRNLLITALSFIFVLFGGLGLMKVVSITLQIPELRMANEFSALVMLKVVAYLVLFLVGVFAAIKAEQYRKQ